MPKLYPRVFTACVIGLLILAGVSGGCLSPSGPAAPASPVTTVPATTPPPVMTSPPATPAATATTGGTVETRVPTDVPPASLPSSPSVESGVAIQNFAFSPSSLTVPAGTTVTWTNMDSATHDAAPLAGSPVAFASPPLLWGNSFRFTFTGPGTYRYYCTFHPSMRGTIVVTS